MSFLFYKKEKGDHLKEKMKHDARSKSMLGGLYFMIKLEDGVDGTGSRTNKIGRQTESDTGEFGMNVGL